MKYGLRERLIGALVLIFCAIVFMPMVFQGPAPKPPISEKVEAPPEPAPVEVEVPDTVEPRLDPVPKPEPTRAERLEMAAQGGAELWTIQVASFSQASNARQLMKRLQAAGLHPYWRQSNGMAVVFAGPYLDQDVARRDQDKLLQDQGLKTLLSQYINERDAAAAGALPPKDQQLP